jgi:hypothetical protein
MHYKTATNHESHDFTKLHVVELSGILEIEGKYMH